MFETPGHPPFREELIDVRPHDPKKHLSRLQIPAETPGLYVRTIDMAGSDAEGRMVENVIDWDAHHITSEADTYHLLLGAVDKALTELATDYGVAVPPYLNIIGPGYEIREGGRDIRPVMGYTIVKAVTGVNATQVTAPEATLALDTLGENVISYYQRKFVTNTLCLPDLRPQQFIYGPLYGKASTDMYLVDLDPYVYFLRTHPFTNPTVTNKLFLDTIKLWDNLANDRPTELICTLRALTGLTKTLEAVGITIEP